MLVQNLSSKILFVKVTESINSNAPDNTLAESYDNIIIKCFLKVERSLPARSSYDYGSILEVAGVRTKALELYLLLSKNKINHKKQFQALAKQHDIQISFPVTIQHTFCDLNKPVYLLRCSQLKYDTLHLQHVQQKMNGLLKDDTVAKKRTISVPKQKQSINFTQTIYN